jgi:glucose/arabinose dehydrogenase
MRLVGADGRVGPTITGLPPVWDRGQGGLLDVAASPDFAQDRRLWWTFAAPVEGGAATALATGVLSADGGALGDVAVLWVQAPGLGTQQHFGSRVVVDGDHVFVTTGDRGQHGRPDLVQDTGTGLGKVIRLRRDGAVPGDNPLPGNPLWSLGHRNVQGATLGPDGRLWTVEHGPQGGDELNRPAPGANHGWPLVTYGEEYGGGPIGPGEPRGPGLEEPVYYWDPVIAPGGMAFHHGGLFAGWRGDLLIGSMNPGGLVRLRLEGDRVVGEERLLEGAARVRDVEVLGDGSVLLLIDSGRGAIWRVTPG